MTQKNQSHSTLMPQAIAAIILAAGKGSRMRSDTAKTLHRIGRKTMLDHVLDQIEQVSTGPQVIVIGHGREQITRHFAQTPRAQIAFALQEEQKGTGHAVMMAEAVLRDFKGDILIAYGDAPLISAATMAKLIKARQSQPQAIALLGCRPHNPTGYGRLKQNSEGQITAIIEEKDASPSDRAIPLCNAGMMCLDAQALFGWLKQLSCHNEAGEYYLTDLIAIAARDGHFTYAIEADIAEVQGVNSLSELAEAEKSFQAQKRREMLDKGVLMQAPETVFFSHDTQIEAGAIIEPYVVFATGVTVKAGAIIKSFSHLEGALLDERSEVGPYARLRAGSHIGAQAKIGNFVEVKKAHLDEGAKASHLAYLGDAYIGAGANIGAGTITCNYDGIQKHHSHIGKGAFIGSNSALIAPVHIGDGAIIGAGSSLGGTIDNNALALTRPPVKNIKDGALKYRARQKTDK